MIKFFRNIRQNLLTENKTERYFKYAIGEIILVVIGILIALSINNWNDQRKFHKTIKNLYSIVKSDLQSDIKNIDAIIDPMQSRDSIFKKVIGNTMTREDYKNCDDCLYIISGYTDFELEKRGFNLLEENSSLFDTLEDSLKHKINSFYSYYNTEIGVDILSMQEDYLDNYFYWKNNMPWFNDYFKRDGKPVKNDDLINYLLTQDYRNRVGSYYLLHYKIHLIHLIKYKIDALKIIKDIDDEIE